MGKPLIHHVIDSIRPHVIDVLISRNRNNPGYDQLGYQCVADADNCLLGPLAGVSSCLDHIRTDLVLVVPCDTPNLPNDLVPELLAHLKDAPLVTASDKSNEQPLIFLARLETLQNIRLYLNEGNRSARGWLETITHETATFTTTQAFENINDISQLR